ncbi:helix-turn-helix transcriptional regulator [Lysinimonas soli]|uniref:Helix-turn-helix transcriptional regulator n=1 Tax=Lysinimonas soli TaxID=1074233 RepID=A0ABW0NQS3_9MICO
MPPSSASQATLRVPVEERLFSLVLALLATESGLTKNEILSTVQGYRQKYKAGGDNANLERQFERDKDDIRDLGVPLETIDTPGEAGNNQTLRYRIPRGSYELPRDISFSSDETTLLNLAAMVWREGSLSGESRRALLKLRSLGVAADEPVLGYAPRVRLRDAAFEPLSAALEKRLIVRFPYLTPGEDSAREREVIPLALVQYQGRWHLSAEEVPAPAADTRGAYKTYLLRRIVGPIAAGKAAPPRPGDHASAALAALDEVWERGIAEVSVVCDSDAATRLANRRGTERLDPDSGAAEARLQLHYVDVNILADELAGFGPEVLVLSPPELREAVIARLERTVRDHG